MHLSYIFSSDIRNLQAKKSAVRQANAYKFLLYAFTLKEIKLKITGRC